MLSDAERGEAPAREWRLRAAGAWPAYEWASARVVTGAFHTVVVVPGAVVARFAAGRGHADRAQRETDAIRLVELCGLPYAVPRVLDGPVAGPEHTAVLTTCVPGAHSPDASWHQTGTQWAGVLAAFGAVSAAHARALPPPRQWCGGDEWPEIATGLVPTRLRQQAERITADVLRVERTDEPCFVHGDLGLHNVLWTGGAITGLLDTDHACCGDPASDVAPLIGAFSAERVRSIVAPEVVERAMYHRASLSLQVAAAAELAGNQALRDHAVANFVARVEAGTEYDPDGARPAS